MFSQNNEEKKLDWMYKGPGGAVDREEYLLGRSVDKSLEQLNAAEKNQSAAHPPKNHVEHECIPPSIRDFKRQQLGEQVDLAQKLQEDPLIAIKKREEEARQRLLQNPVQLKKLQKVLKIKNSKKKKKKDKKRKRDTDSSDDNLDRKLSEKYALMKNLNTNTSDDDELDQLLNYKFMKFKHLLTKSDLEDILCVQEDDDKKNSKKYDSSSDSDKPKNKKKYNSSSEDEIENKTSKQLRTEHSKSFVRKSNGDNLRKWKNRKNSSNESDTDDSSQNRRKVYTRKETNNSYPKKETNLSDRRYNMAPEDNKRRHNKEYLEDERKNREKNEKRRNKEYLENETKNRERNEKRHRRPSEERRYKYEEERRYKYEEENENPRRSRHHEKYETRNEYDDDHRRRSSKRRVESVRKSRTPEDEKISHRRRRETRQSTEKYAEDRRKESTSKYREDDRRRESKNEGRGSKSKRKEIKKIPSPESERFSEGSIIIEDASSRISANSRMYYDSDDYDEKLKKKRNFGLIKADGSKIIQDKYKEECNKREIETTKEKPKEDAKQKPEKDYKSRLTEEEKELIRREMMKNAALREQEMIHTISKYRREESEKEVAVQEYNPDFLSKELMKSASHSTVESRIKSNLNNIQRSSKDMDSHFSRRKNE